MSETWVSLIQQGAQLNVGQISDILLIVCAIVAMCIAVVAMKCMARSKASMTIKGLGIEVIVKSGEQSIDNPDVADDDKSISKP